MPQVLMLETTSFFTLIVEDGHPTVSKFAIYNSGFTYSTVSVNPNPDFSGDRIWLAQHEATAYLLWLVVAKMILSHGTTTALNPWGLGRQLSKNKRSLWNGKMPSNVSISSSIILESEYPVGWSIFQKFALEPNDYLRTVPLQNMSLDQATHSDLTFLCSPITAWKSFAIPHDLYWVKANWKKKLNFLVGSSVIAIC